MGTAGGRRVAVVTGGTAGVGRAAVPEHPMPVPPVFQPEVAARAIAYLTEHPRRNMWVGVSTAYTVLGGLRGRVPAPLNRHAGRGSRPACMSRCEEIFLAGRLPGFMGRVTR